MAIHIHCTTTATLTQITLHQPQAGMGKIEIFALSTLLNKEQKYKFFLHTNYILFHSDLIYSAQAENA
jgi:hypothetical protein